MPTAPSTGDAHRATAMMHLLATALRAHSPATEPDAAGLAWAAVALILRGETVKDAELLFIRRAQREGDPWSGQIAFPGGRRARHDASLQVTAERETQEELSVNLSRVGTCLGVLSDLCPRSPALPSIVVRPYVYRTQQVFAIRPNHEVESTFWIPLTALVDPAYASEFTFMRDGATLSFPAYRWNEHTVWGMTERITTQLLAVIRSMPA
jgi:8-oxo-dGTP pyrophosphatase MutT (NUDIX family)